jgi:hypothetical protein
LCAMEHAHGAWAHAPDGMLSFACAPASDSLNPSPRVPADSGAGQRRETRALGGDARGGDRGIRPLGCRCHKDGRNLGRLAPPCRGERKSPARVASARKRALPTCLPGSAWMGRTARSNEAGAKAADTGTKSSSADALQPERKQVRGVGGQG